MQQKNIDGKTGSDVMEQLFSGYKKIIDVIRFRKSQKF